MSIRHFDALFKPRSVALIGASKTPHSVGAVLARNLLRGGFDGPVMPVNPKHEAIEGVLAYRDVKRLPVAPDLAVIATPPERVPKIVAQLGARGTRAVVVITAGFGELGPEGERLQQEVLDAAKPHNLRVVGPNCVGILVPGIGLNASFSHLPAAAGRVAFVTQSGAIVTSVLDWAQPRGIGFSHLVSLGDMADVDFGDMLDYLANDPETTAILLYIEGVKHARKFMSAARAASRMKPVIVVKAGRHEESARAAASHTGSLAGSDAVYDAAFRRAGMLRVNDLEDLFVAVETLAMTAPPSGDRLAILTNGGGMGVLATDALMDAGGRLAELVPETMGRLDEILPPTWSKANPVDIIGDADGPRYAGALEALLQDPGVDAVLVLNCPTAVASSRDAAQVVIEAAQRHPKAAVFTSWVGRQTAEVARRLFAEGGVPTYDTPDHAAGAFMAMVSYRRSQEMLMETPPSVPEEFTPDTGRVREILAAAAKEEREWLLGTEVEQVLVAYGIPVVTSRHAANPDEAAACAAEMATAVVLKLASPDITHKTDVGGVAIDLRGPAAVREAATAMLERVAEKRPEARISGFTLQPVVYRPGAFELIVGASEDERFGPVVLFGHGGTEVEVVRDKALGLPPLNMRLAHDVISRTRISRLLGGYRGRRGVNLDAVALTLIRVAQLVVDLPEIAEAEMNPLLADEEGVLAIDARLRIQPASESGVDRLAIRPYPKELEEIIPVADGRTLLLRPILPEDEPSLQEHFSRLTPEQVYLRFFAPLKTLSHMMAARFTQLDYDREMALVLTEPGIAGKTPIYGVVRVSADPDNERGEYAIVVDNEMTGMGLGVLLMRRIIDYARKRGMGEIWGDVLQENSTMRKLCKVLGFREKSDPDDPSIVTVSLDLRKARGGARAT